MKKYGFKIHIGIFVIASLFSTGNSLATIKQLPTITNTSQAISTRSFNETTELAVHVWDKLNSRFVQAYDSKQYQVAKDIAQSAYDLANANFGIDDVNTADSLLKLGIISQTMGNLNEAEDDFLGALVILEDQLSPNNPDTAIVLTNLGNLYYDRKEYKKSEQYHKKALNIRMSAFGKEDTTTAQSYYNLAVLYENTKDYKKAETLYSKAITVWTRAYGPFHPFVGNTLNNLLNVYMAQSKIPDAIKTELKTVAYKKATLGPENEQVAQSLIDLGKLYVEQGRYATAGGSYKEALNIARTLLKPDDPQLAMLMYTLANTYHMQAQSEQSSKKINTNGTAMVNSRTRKNILVKKALPLYEQAAKILGVHNTAENQPALKVVLSQLAMLYKAIGEKDKAVATQARIEISH
jgi:tetratricopeptide (TPR) repeat protein